MNPESHPPDRRPDRPGRRSLRITTLGLLLVLVAALLVLLYLPLRKIILDSFAELEIQTIQTNVSRTRNAFDQVLAGLNRTTGDYATWDDTYAFIDDRNQEYIDSNMTADTLLNNRLSLIAYYDSNGDLIHSEGFDLAAQEKIEVPALFLDLPHEPLLAHLTVTSAISGLLLLPEGPMLVASRPIITSNAEGPIRGSLVMGRMLDQETVAQIGATTQLSVTMLRLDAGPLDPAAEAARTALLGGQRAVADPRSAEQIAGYGLIRDLAGAPALLLRIEMERSISRRAQESMLYVTVALGAVGLAGALLMMFLLERLVLARLIRLRDRVVAIGAAGDTAARLPAGGSDELGQLGTAINAMLAQIEQNLAGREEAEQARLGLQEQIISMQSATLARLSTPLIPISDNVVVLPLIGDIDAERGQRLTTTLLNGIAERRVSAAIIDITGVPSLDAAAIAALLNATRAAQLLGASVILTGISAAAATALAGANVDLGGVVTRSSLQSGIAHALRGQPR